MSEHIFISYSKKDSDFALKLADDLIAAGFKIWIDRSIEAGEQWRDTINKNLQAASDVIVVLSPNAIASRWVQHEGSMAYAWGKKIYSMMMTKVPDSDLPIWMEEFQYIDFVNTPYEVSLERLKKTLTPRNLIQELLDQQVYAYEQTNELIGESLLAVIEEERDRLTISDQAEELIEKSTSRMIRTRRLWRGGIGLAIVLIAVAIFAIITMIGANNARSRAVSALSGAETKQAQVLATATQVSQEMNMALTQQAQAEMLAAAAQAEAEDYNRQSQIKALYLRASALASQSRQAQSLYPQRSLLLAVEAVNITQNEDLSRALIAEQVLREALNEFDERVLSGSEDWITTLAFNPDGRFLATGGSDKIVRIWDLQASEDTSTARMLLGHAGEIKTMAFSPDSRYLVSAGEDHSALLWDTTTALNTDLNASNTNAIALELSGHEGKIPVLAFSPDGRYLATGSWDKTVRIWDVTQVKDTGLNTADFPVQPVVLQGHNRGINTLAFSPDGGLLATGGWDNTVYIWDVSAATNGQPVADSDPLLLQGHRGGVNALAFSPNGKFLATGGWDNTIRIWDIAAIIDAPELEAQSITLRGHQDEVNVLLFGPNGEFLATGSQDTTARLWHLPTVFNTESLVSAPATQAYLLRGHEGGINNLAFSPDGGFLATGGNDTSVRIWDLYAEDPTTQPIILQGHEDWITALSFGPEGRFLATGSRDTTARTWDMNIENLVEIACQQTGRNLSLDEWEQYFSNEKYRKTCEQWPISPDLLERAQNFALKGDTESAIILFELVLELDPDQELDPQAEAQKFAALGLVSQGDELAKQGDIEGALDKYQEAQALDPSLDIDPQAEAQKYVIQELISAGNELAEELDIEGAIAKFEEALEYDASLDLDPEAEVARLAAPKFVEHGMEIAKGGQIGEAIAAFTEAQSLDPDLVISADSWNTLCWYGGLWGDASDVLTACNQAVELDPENGRYRESRGLVLALTENFQGALEDFEFFVTWAKESGLSEEYIVQREIWIAELKEDRNPFDSALLEELRNE